MTNSSSRRLAPHKIGAAICNLANMLVYEEIFDVQFKIGSEANVAAKSFAKYSGLSVSCIEELVFGTLPDILRINDADWNDLPRDEFSD